MLFWDSSALLAIILHESSAALLRPFLDEDPEVASSFITPLEIVSTIWRRQHADLFSLAQVQDVDQLYSVITKNWITLGDTRTIDVALRLVARQPLRTGDAIQLASALEVADREGVMLPFVTLDEELGAAARAEGLRVLP
jgi:predicted nucleic acid-binding protein